MTPQKITAALKDITLVAAEELVVERVLIAVYPQPNAEARACAKQLLGVAVKHVVRVDWTEITRLAQSPAYRVYAELKALVKEVCDELEIGSPLDSN